jgi:hypothetical protein
MTPKIIPNLPCPDCGGAMFFSNPPRNGAVECVNSVSHRKRVRQYTTADGVTVVTFCKTGPAKVYPVTYDMQITQAQRDKIAAHGGAEWVRGLIDNAA